MPSSDVGVSSLSRLPASPSVTREGPLSRPKTPYRPERAMFGGIQASRREFFAPREHTASYSMNSTAATVDSRVLNLPTAAALNTGARESQDHPRTSDLLRPSPPARVPEFQNTDHGARPMAGRTGMMVQARRMVRSGARESSRGPETCRDPTNLATSHAEQPWLPAVRELMFVASMRSVTWNATM